MLVNGVHDVIGDHPRIRGEHHEIFRKANDRRGIIPAYAGSTSVTVRILTSCRDHPRIRGEHRARNWSVLSLAGSSPHTRGALVGRQLGARDRGIIPAYAGNTDGLLTMPPAFRDHPRIRGEHVSRFWKLPKRGGSSPHTRGALILCLVRGIALGIIPAYAGSTHRR